MNKQYPFTPEGVERKQAQLFELNDDELEKVAIEISKDLRAWIFNNFEVTDEQKEYYSNVPKKFNLATSWNVASSVLGRNYTTMGEVPKSYTSEQKRKRNTKTTISGGVNYNSGTGDVTITVGGSFSF